MTATRLTGTIEKGAGQGAFFTQLGWFVAQCRRALGWKPFPGTLNIRVNDTGLDALERFLGEADFEFVPDDPAFCSARVKKVTVNGIAAAVILLPDAVRIHEKRVLEVIAPCHLKSALGVGDGACVTLAASEKGVPGGRKGK